MNSNHTPTPYHVGEGKASIIIYDSRGNAIADAKTFHGKHEDGQAEANAAFIVRACNSHAELLEALETLLKQYDILLDELTEEEFSGYPEVIAARAALAKAKGEQEGGKA